MGTMGVTTSLRVPNRQQQCLQVAKQIEASRPPYPIMRRLHVDREEKRVTYGNGRRCEELIRNAPFRVRHFESVFRRDWSPKSCQEPKATNRQAETASSLRDLSLSGRR
jgi:hypothetical protein